MKCFTGGILTKAIPMVCLGLLIHLLGPVDAYAATPTPPFLCSDDATCSSTPYSIGEVPFAYSWPEKPTITSEAIVTPGTIAENKINGRRIILSPGEYGDQTFNTQDQEIVIQEGVEIGFLDIGSSAARLEFRATPPRAGRMRYISTPFGGGNSDILFDGITQVHAEREWDMRNFFHGSRIAVINSSLRALDFVASTFPSSGGPTDLIFANNYMEAFGSQQAGVRLQNVQRLVFVDNRVHKTGSSHHSFRVHAPEKGQQANNLYVARNQIGLNGMQIRPSQVGTNDDAPHAGMNNVWFVDNELYHTANDVITLGPTSNEDVPQRFRLRGNRLFTDSSRNWPGQVLSTWVVEGNSRLPYQSPPQWNFQ